MRHRKIGRHLGRMSAHRNAMFRNMISSLIEHEAIRTTLPKAKELRRFAEPLITLAKIDSVANRRLAFARLGNRDAVTKLFTLIGPRCFARQGGYLRILKCGNRQNDCAPMAYIELVDKATQESLSVKKTKKEKKKVKTEKQKDSKKATESKSEKTNVKKTTSKES